MLCKVKNTVESPVSKLQVVERRTHTHPLPQTHTHTHTHTHTLPPPLSEISHGVKKGLMAERFHRRQGSPPRDIGLGSRKAALICVPRADLAAALRSVTHAHMEKQARMCVCVCVCVY